jgi:hypothetical protein
MHDKINTDNLCPLAHPDNWHLYRVPLRRVGDDHYVYFGNGLCRIYTSKTLPDCIKHKLTMVLASNSIGLADEDSRSFGIFSLMNVCPQHMGEIGWRSSNTYFVVVISREDLDSLIGEALDKECEYGNDT